MIVSDSDVRPPKSTDSDPDHDTVQVVYVSCRKRRNRRQEAKSTMKRVSSDALSHYFCAVSELHAAVIKEASRIQAEYPFNTISNETCDDAHVNNAFKVPGYEDVKYEPEHWGKLVIDLIQQGEEVRTRARTATLLLKPSLSYGSDNSDMHVIESPQHKLKSPGKKKEKDKTQMLAVKKQTSPKSLKEAISRGGSAGDVISTPVRVHSPTKAPTPKLPLTPDQSGSNIHEASPSARRREAVKTDRTKPEVSVSELVDSIAKLLPPMVTMTPRSPNQVLALANDSGEMGTSNSPACELIQTARSDFATDKIEREKKKPSHIFCITKKSKKLASPKSSNEGGKSKCANQSTDLGRDSNKPDAYLVGGRTIAWAEVIEKHTSPTPNRSLSSSDESISSRSTSLLSPYGLRESSRVPETSSPLATPSGGGWGVLDDVEVMGDKNSSTGEMNNGHEFVGKSLDTATIHNAEISRTSDWLESCQQTDLIPKIDPASIEKRKRNPAPLSLYSDKTTSFILSTEADAALLLDLETASFSPIEGIGTPNPATPSIDIAAMVVKAGAASTIQINRESMLLHAALDETV